MATLPTDGYGYGYDPNRTLALRNEIMGSLRPAMEGAPGSSPLTQAAIDAWKVNTMPLLQMQMKRQGYERSPAFAQVQGESLATAMPQFIQADIANRLQANQTAAGLIPQDYGMGQLEQSGAKLSADIANQEQMRALEAARTGGQFMLGYGDLAVKNAQIQQQQQQLALQAAQGAGGVQRDIAQQFADAQQAERLRQQGLTEQSTTGLFGGTVLPPTLQQGSKTKSSSSK